MGVYAVQQTDILSRFLVRSDQWQAPRKVVSFSRKQYGIGHSSYDLHAGCVKDDHSKNLRTEASRSVEKLYRLPSVNISTLYSDLWV